MAARVVSLSKKLLKSLCNGKFFSTRPLNSSSPSSSILINLTTEKPEQPPIDLHQLTNTTSLNLHDVEKLFSSVPTTKLLRASANLQMAAMEPVVDFGMWVMNSKLMDIEVFKEIVLGFVKHTFYERFCAGEDALATGGTVRRLHNGGAGLRAMLDYAMEYAGDNQSCDRNLEAFLRTRDGHAH
ncbi:hypothetical protein ACB092_01G123100 [Castanea dentata]